MDGKYRLLFISDSPYPISTTGFAIVSGQLLDGLLRCGHFDVAYLGRGPAPREGEVIPYRFYQSPYSDPNGYQYAQYVCEMEKPHLIVIEADPGSIYEWRKNVEVRRIPNLVHVPVEGAPLLPPWSDALREIALTGGMLTTYTHFGQVTIDKGAFTAGDDPDVPRCRTLYLGVDHANFRRYTLPKRERLREHLGWSDKFVVMNVARNAGRKGWPRLLEAIALLKDKYPNILLYAHTVPFENHFLHGHNLMALAKEYGITKHIQFMAELRNPTQGIAYDGKPDELTLVDMYNAADLFVAPTQGEGWNLPVCEAAACGLPVLTTQYAGGWEIAQNFALPLVPHDYTTHTTGLRQANVAPQEIANVIELMIHCPEQRQVMSMNGESVVSKYPWQPTVERFAQLAVEICERNKKG